ncbi:MAG: NUDIX domain-containing protein [Micromonosporaceae bacterium]
MGGEYTSHVDVFLYLHDGDKVLLALRRNTGYADEMWNLPSGKLEAGEHVLAAVLREAREEIGIVLDPGAVELAGVVHHRTQQVGRVGLVFRASYDAETHGAPFNAEPHKCGGIEWHPHDDLPADTVDYTAACVNLVRRASPLLLHGWQTSVLES